MFKGRRLVCADGTLLARAQRASLRTRCLAAPVQRALGRLYLPGNDLMLHVAMGTELEGELQMLFDQLVRLRRGYVLILDRVLIDQIFHCDNEADFFENQAFDF